MRPSVLLCMIRGADHMAEAFLERADIEIITLYDVSTRLLQRKGIPHRRLNDLLTDDLRNRVLREAESRAVAIGSTLSSPEMRESYSADEALWSRMTAAVVNALQRDLAEEIAAVELVRRLALETDLQLVFVPEDVCRDTKTVISAARVLGVPSLHLLHGFPYGTTNAHDTVTADVVAAYSERAKAIYESFGAASDRVVVTGNPLWDTYACPPASGRREQVCTAMGLDPSRPIIEYALTGPHRFSAVSIRHPNYHEESAEAVLGAFASLSRRYPEWQFLLRLHPIDQEPIERLSAHAKKAGLEHITLDAQTPYDALNVVDTMLCTHSNLGIEALLMGKPVINVALDALAAPVFREGMGPLFLDDDAVLWARNEAEIEPAIEAAILDASVRESLLALRPKSIERFNGWHDGGATERVCALALDMMAHGRRYAQPVERFPALESALAGAVPVESKRVLVLGRSCRPCARTVTHKLPDAEIVAAESVSTEPAEFDAVVVADPVPHDSTCESVLRTALAHIANDGVIVASFCCGVNHSVREAFEQRRWAPRRSGATEAVSCVGEFSQPGIDILLSRCGLESVGCVEVPQHPVSPRDMAGWVVCARRLPDVPSPLNRWRAGEKSKAEEANARGEAAYARGDVLGAITAFTQAIGQWREEAVYYNNLATALHTVGRSQEAYAHLLNALHLDPNLKAARENLRAVADGLDRSVEADALLAMFGEA